MPAIRASLAANRRPDHTSAAGIVAASIQSPIPSYVCPGGVKRGTGGESRRVHRLCGDHIASGLMSLGSLSHNSGVKRIRGLPLIDCSGCGREQLRLLQSTTLDNPGKFFVKCPRNEKGKKIAKDCSFFMWLEQYRQFIGQLGMSNGDEHVAASIELDEVWRSVEAMRIEVAGMNARMDKFGKTIYLQILVTFCTVFVVVLILLVVLVK